MTKARFLNDLRRNLKDYPKGFVDQTLDYYSEAIQDGINDGLTEKESIERLGSLSKILESIRENALATGVKRVHNKFRASNIILAIILFPLWFPLMVAGFVIIWAFGFAVVVSELALIVSGFTVTFSSFGLIMEGLPAAFGLNFGGGLFALGLSVLGAILVYFVVKLVIKLHLKLFRYIKSLIQNGGVSYE